MNCVCGHKNSEHDFTDHNCMALIPDYSTEPMLGSKMVMSRCPCRKFISAQDNIVAPQTAPKPGHEIVYPELIADMLKRVTMGQHKYGTLLQTKNGRDVLADAYAEAIDLCFYLKQALMERDNNEHGDKKL